MRGVHYPFNKNRIECKGSSPHARGPRSIPISIRNAHGIIPACAGSTDGQLNLIESQEDHPRMRGVHTKKMPKIRHFS